MIDIVESIAYFIGAIILLLSGHISFDSYLVVVVLLYVGRCIKEKKE